MDTKQFFEKGRSAGIQCFSTETLNNFRGDYDCLDNEYMTKVVQNEVSPDFIDNSILSFFTDDDYQNIFKKNKKEEKTTVQNTTSKSQSYKCFYENCLKEYKSKENLRLHILNFHQKSKPYSCKYCGEPFSHRNGKIYHERNKHTLYFPFVCPYNSCNKSFPNKSSMNSHIKRKHLH